MRFLFMYLFNFAVAGIILVTAMPDNTQSLLMSGDQCVGQEILVTEALRVGRDTVNVTVPACAGYIPKLHPIDPTESILARRAIEARRLAARSPEPDTKATSPSECINPSICQCGQSCTVTCDTFDSSAPLPSVSDCDKLIDILRSFQATIGPTFVQGTGFPNPIIVDFSTCRVAFGNTRTDGNLIEYCWDGLADNVNSIVNGCIAPGVMLAGTCTANSNIWAMSAGGYPRVG